MRLTLHPIFTIPLRRPAIMKSSPLILIFTLSMPGNNSWNGKWSDEGRSYAIRHKLTTQKAIKKARSFIGYHSYNFGDGWRAGVEVKEVDSITAKKIMKGSQGFCGYDWMVESILRDGKIYGPTQPKPALTLASTLLS